MNVLNISGKRIYIPVRSACTLAPVPQLGPHHPHTLTYCHTPWSTVRLLYFREKNLHSCEECLYSGSSTTGGTPSLTHPDLLSAFYITGRRTYIRVRSVCTLAPVPQVGPHPSHTLTYCPPSILQGEEPTFVWGVPVLWLQYHRWNPNPNTPWPTFRLLYYREKNLQSCEECLYSGSSTTGGTPSLTHPDLLSAFYITGRRTYSHVRSACTLAPVPQVGPHHPHTLTYCLLYYREKNLHSCEECLYSGSSTTGGTPSHTLTYCPPSILQGEEPTFMWGVPVLWLQYHRWDPIPHTPWPTVRLLYYREKILQSCEECLYSGSSTTGGTPSLTHPDLLSAFYITGRRTYIHVRSACTLAPVPQVGPHHSHTLTYCLLYYREKNLHSCEECLYSGSSTTGGTPSLTLTYCLLYYREKNLHSCEECLYSGSSTTGGTPSLTHPDLLSSILQGEEPAFVWWVPVFWLQYNRWDSITHTPWPTVTHPDLLSSILQGEEPTFMWGVSVLWLQYHRWDPIPHTPWPTVFYITGRRTYNHVRSACTLAPVPQVGLHHPHTLTYCHTPWPTVFYITGRRTYNRVRSACTLAPVPQVGPHHSLTLTYCLLYYREKNLHSCEECLYSGSSTTGGTPSLTHPDLLSHTLTYCPPSILQGEEPTFMWGVPVLWLQYHRWDPIPHTPWPTARLLYYREKNLHSCEECLYSGSSTTGGTPTLTHPDLVSAFSQLESQMKKINQAIKDICTDIEKKKQVSQQLIVCSIF